MMSPYSSYTLDPFIGRRRVTREVKVGDIGIGGANPIRVQSMTNTDTRDVRTTVDQVEQLEAAGCEIVRLAVPSIRDAEVLGDIRGELKRRSVVVPLVADIHFTPNAAMIAAEYMEKVRVNPGNYVDKKKFEVREFSDSQYEVEVEKVSNRFRPLVLRCRELGVAMRIGTNHGSLSDRIMNRFGDTPLGMVESALEFLDVCESENYHDVVFSMKSSNTQVAIQAYRLLAKHLEERGPVEGGSYPFHVGVTEAGDSEDGRIKSAIGIGALLEDGLGDTIRVSLTEHPVREVPVAEAIARRAQSRWRADEQSESVSIREDDSLDPYSFERRSTVKIGEAGLELGADQPIRVELDLGKIPSQPVGDWALQRASQIALLPDLKCEGIQLAMSSAADLDGIAELRAALSKAGLPQSLAVLIDVSSGCESSLDSLPAGVSRLVGSVSKVTDEAACLEFARFAARIGSAVEWRYVGQICDLPEAIDSVLRAGDRAGLDRILISAVTPRAHHGARALAACLAERDRGEIPIVLRYDADPERDSEAVMLDIGVDLGASLCDGLGDAIVLAGFSNVSTPLDLAYRVLQGARRRVTRTEFISCPSCGRTLFDLEEVTAQVKELTRHLKGVKIAIMGCIVNGPGEMADADFGYVGSGVGLVTLYVGKEIHNRNVPEHEAPGQLVRLIKDSGRWVDPA